MTTPTAEEVFESALGCERVQVWMRESRIGRDDVREAAVVSAGTGEDVEELLAVVVERNEGRVINRLMRAWYGGKQD